MGNFFNERNSGRRGGGRSERPTMHRAVCDKCGKDCEVPFKPSGDKPIYCSRCFENVEPKRESRDSRGGGRSRDYGRDNSRDYGRDNSRDYKKTETTSVDISPLKDQLSSINTKLDVLIDILKTKEEVKPKKVVKKVVSKKTKK